MVIPFAHTLPLCVQVVDTSNGCGQGFDVVVVAEAFEGKKLLEKHRCALPS
jgi:stress-induced morphogen